MAAILIHNLDDETKGRLRGKKIYPPPPVLISVIALISLQGEE